MNATIKAVKGRCPFCLPARGNNAEQPLFLVRSEQLNSFVCGPHLHGFLTQLEEPSQEPVPNGQPAAPH